MIVSIVLNRVLHESIFSQHDLNPSAIANIKHGIISDMELSRTMTDMTHPSAIANIKHGIISDMELSRTMTDMTHPSVLTSPPFK